MKQLYEVLTVPEIRAMSVKERRDRIALCEHQLKNKERALQYIDPKPYMLTELAGLRTNITQLKATRA